jgi:hypothetical protein
MGRRGWRLMAWRAVRLAIGTQVAGEMIGEWLGPATGLDALGNVQAASDQELSRERMVGEGEPTRGGNALGRRHPGRGQVTSASIRLPLRRIVARAVEGYVVVASDATVVSYSTYKMPRAWTRTANDDGRA